MTGETFRVPEQRLVKLLVSGLPEQLKSRLSEEELEQFASSLISRLISDGLLNSITPDGVAESKEIAVR